MVSMRFVKYFLMLDTVCLLFIVLLCPLCIAQPNMIIKDVIVELLDIRPPVGEIVIREYRITAILHNTGDTKSVNITVKLQDPQSGAGTLTLQPQRYSFEPNEEKEFIFENWPTPLTGNVLLNISCGPWSSNITQTSENSDFYLYTLQIGDPDTTPSTPGFEILAVFISFLAFLLKNKVKKRMT